MNRGDKQALPAPGVPVDNWLPPIGEPVWVLCDGYRTMATLDAKGVWRNLADGRELKGVLNVIRPQA